MYNPKLLKINFHELFHHSLDSFLYDDILITALYEKSYYFLVDKCPYDDKNELKIKVLENYFLYLSSKKILSTKERTHLNFLHDFYFNMFSLNPILFYKSSIYKYRDLVFPEFGKSVYEKLKSILDKSSKNVKKYLEGELLNHQDISFLLLSYSGDSNIEESIKDQIISYIIANFKDCTSFEKVFLLEAINKEINPQNASLITISHSLLDENVFTALLKLLIEIKHTTDLMVPANMEFSAHSLSLLNTFLASDLNEEYNLETKKFALEKLNAIFSKYDDSGKYLAKVAHESKKLSKNSSIKKINKPCTNIITSVKNNPDLLNEYPQLKLLFNIDGSLKDISELIKLYLFLNTNLEEISKKTPIVDLIPIIDFIEYELLSRKPILLANQSKDYLYAFFDIISYLINRRCSEIEKLLKQIINNPRQKEDISKIIENHFIIIDEYLKYLNYYRLNLSKDSYIDTGFISLEAMILKTKDNYTFIMKCSTLKLLSLK